MATIMAMPSTFTRAKVKLPAWARTLPSWAGMRLTTLVKIRIDMPLPIPRWVMSSPSHMIMAVPAVSVVTISSTRAAPKWGIRSMPLRALEEPRKLPPPWWRAKTMPVDCIRASATVR